MDELTSLLCDLNLNSQDKVVKIQAWFRGVIFRLKRLPSILFYIKSYLEKSAINLSDVSSDGRINSSIDETIVIELLKTKFKNRICKSSERMWFDLMVKDYLFGWIPVNLKTTTMKTADNTGNLAMCVYAYTNENLDLTSRYSNGDMSKLLIKKILNKEINFIPKKDYYFLVIDKCDTKNIIINSLKGLSLLTPNINNLPFQIKWDKNSEFTYISY